jgi:hypothetical protein
MSASLKFLPSAALLADRDDSGPWNHAPPGTMRVLQSPVVHADASFGAPTYESTNREWPAHGNQMLRQYGRPTSYYQQLQDLDLLAESIAQRVGDWFWRHR